MSTQKWPDDDLDDLFRKSAEESDPVYDPVAWQDLKARLNDRDRIIFLRWAAPTLLLLLVIGSIGWYIRQPDSNSKSAPTGSKLVNSAPSKPSSSSKPALSVQAEPDAKISNRSVTTSTIQPAEAGPITRLRSTGPHEPADQSTADIRDRKKATGSPAGTHRPDRQIAKADQTSDSDHQRTTEPRSVDAYTPLAASTSSDKFTPAAKAPTSRLLTRARARQTRDQNTKRVYLRALTGQHNLMAGRMGDSPNGTARQDAKTGGLGRHRSVMSGLVNKRDATGNGHSNGITTAEPTTTAPADLSTNPENQFPAADRFVWPTPGLLAGKNAQWQVPVISMPEPTVENNRTTMQRSARFRQSGLSIQAVLSPDLSTIGLRNFDRPGSNIGVMVQYQLSDRFSLQTGALWSTKLYKTLASEYVWPTSGGMTVWPTSITGKCTMVDIPLNLRYDVLLRPGGPGRGPVRWFISGGVTSYFIKREIYNYTFANPNDPAIKYRNWDSSKGGSFGLSNINVSIGYERPVSRRLSWQIEPFMKIPVQQIGYFKVRLLSTGAFLSLRYRL